MNALDDPTIPDDLAQLLRSASDDLDVSPAELRSVERRARQRRRRRHRRHRAIAGGTAALVLLAGVAIAQVRGRGADHETVIATTPPAPDADSIPQPLLVRREWQATEVPASTDTNDRGWALDSVTPAGATAWWGATGGWHPVGGYELADGRRFGVAASYPTGLGIPPKARLDEIGTQANTISSRTLPLEVPKGGWSASIRPIGATGDEVILQRDTAVRRPLEGTAFELLTDTTYSAIDVDSGEERPLFAVDGEQFAAAAAGDVLVRAPDLDCQIAVSTLTGDDTRTIRGGCPEAPVGSSGRGYEVAVSPDGRYAAVLWMGVAAKEPMSDLLDVIDLDAGASIETKEVRTSVVRGMSWTGLRQLTLATGPDQSPFEFEAHGVTVRSIP